MKKYFTCLILIVLLTQVVFSQEDSNWRGPDRNGIYHGKNLLKNWPDKGPELLWRFNELGRGYSTVAVSSGQVITVGTVDSISYIYSFDMAGKLLWKTKIGPEWMEGDFPGVRATPVIYQGSGYVMNGLGVLFCFDAKTGHIQWSSNIYKKYKGQWGVYGVAESLVVDGEKVFCTTGGKDANVIALNRKTGELIWKCTGNGEKSAFSSSTIIERGGNKFLIGTNSKSIFAIQTDNGKMAWNYQFELEVASNTPIYRDGILFMFNQKEGVAIKISEDGLTTEILWRNENLVVYQGDAVFVGDNLYTLSGKNTRLYCVNWYTGKEICHKQLPEKHQIAAVISADNMIYCYTFCGMVMLIDPQNNKLVTKSSFNLPIRAEEHCSYPVINNGRLFIRINSTLFAYNISSDKKNEIGSN